MEEDNAPESTHVSRLPKAKLLLFAVPAVLLIVAAGSGTYYWQHQKLTRANADITSRNSQINTLDGKVTSLESKVTSLQSQYNQAKSTLDSYQAAAQKSQQSITIATQADLALTVNGAQYVNPEGVVTARATWFGVNVTLTNNTPDTVSIHDSDFHLKDSQGNEYLEETAIGGGSTLPTGWVGLADGTLAPGQSVKGTVEFQMPNDTVKSFNFINVTKVYPVSSAG